jgi:hypothetical protein
MAVAKQSTLAQLSCSLPSPVTQRKWPLDKPQFCLTNGAVLPAVASYIFIEHKLQYMGTKEKGGLWGKKLCLPTWLSLRQCWEIPQGI